VTSTLIALVVFAAGVLIFGSDTQAGETESELAKKTQNPVADLISFPIQYNMNFGIGPNNRAQYAMNVQPVLPISLTNGWNLITRTIMPIGKQPNLETTSEDTWGIGDVTFTGFLSPKAAGPVKWGIGPALQIPTATDEVLGSRKWAAGPEAVVLTIQGPWLVGIRVQNLWSFAGNSDRSNVNQFLTQYFVNYNLPNGWYLTASPTITANWEADSGNTWTVPVGGGVGKVFRIGKLPFNVNVAAYSNVVRPDPGPDWAAQFQFAWLLPWLLSE
jgi:hypothetical protein